MVARMVAFKGSWQKIKIRPTQHTMDFGRRILEEAAPFLQVQESALALLVFDLLVELGYDPGGETAATLTNKLGYEGFIALAREVIRDRAGADLQGTEADQRRPSQDDRVAL